MDPTRFAGQLLAKATAENDYSIVIDGLRAGRIMRQPRSFGRHTWLWTITGPALVQAGLQSSGEAETLQEAKDAFRAAFDRWHAWALQHDGPVYWMEGGARTEGCAVNSRGCL